MPLVEPLYVPSSKRSVFHSISPVVFKPNVRPGPQVKWHSRPGASSHVNPVNPTASHTSPGVAHRHLIFKSGDGGSPSGGVDQADGGGAAPAQSTQAVPPALEDIDVSDYVHITPNPRESELFEFELAIFGPLFGEATTCPTKDKLRAVHDQIVRDIRSEVITTKEQIISYRSNVKRPRIAVHIENLHLRILKLESRFVPRC